MTYLIFDIETIPDYSLYQPPERTANVDRPIAPPYAQIPIVIGVLWLGQDYSFKRLGIVGEDLDERGQLAAFVNFVQNQRPLLVTYNGRSFDLPVIALRSFHHGLTMKWFYGNREYRYRYSDEGHFDLCDFLSEHGASRRLSLSAAARLVGLPGKVGVDGSQVETLHKSGQMEAIRHYCLSDVVQTSFLLLRFRLLQGRLNLPAYQQAASSLFAALEEDGRLSDLLDATNKDLLLLSGFGVEADAEEKLGVEAVEEEKAAAEKRAKPQEPPDTEQPTVDSPANDLPKALENE